VSWDAFASATEELLAVLDQEGRFVDANPRWRELVGYAPDELMGTRLVELVLQECREPTARTLEAWTREGSRNLRFVNHLVHRGGHLVRVEWFVSRGEDGLAYATAREVEPAHEDTERDALLAAIEAHAQIGSWRVDLITRELTWSPTIFRIFGLDPAVSEPTLDSAIAAYHPDDRESVAQAVERIIERGEPFSFEARALRPDGTIRWVVAEGLVDRSSTGVPRVIHGLIRDVTDERARAERLVHVERLASIGKMAASVAHELNNPLQYISMNLGLIEAELGLAPETPAGELVAALEDGVARISAIVQTLRRFARAPAPTRRAVSPAELVEGVLRLLRGSYERDVALLVEYDDDLPQLEVSEQAIHQALTNLMSNAIHAVVATGEGGHVRVRVGHDAAAGRVVFTVTDDGVGLGDVDTGRMFDPFYTTKEVGVGSGLGLSITRGLVAEHGGDVRVEDRPDARGVVATLWLPANPPEPTAGVGAAASDHTWRPGPGEAAAHGSSCAHTDHWVLLVDDESSIVHALSMFLRSEGYRVVETTSALEALDVLGQERTWGMVLCDLRMPDLDGEQFLELVSERHPHLEHLVHFMTGDTWSTRNRAFLNALGRPYLDKPFSLRRLQEFMERCCCAEP
jgi:PAS domain S-box-containing protein